MVLTSISEQIIKAYLDISIIHVKMTSLTTINELKNALFLSTQGESYRVSSLSKKDTCFFFQVDDLYFGLKLNSFQQWESSQLEIAKKDMWPWYFDVRLFYVACAWMTFGRCLFVLGGFWHILIECRI